MLGSVRSADYPVYQLQVLVNKTSDGVTTVEPTLSFYISSLEMDESDPQSFADLLVRIEAWAKNYAWIAVEGKTVTFHSLKVLEATAAGAETVDDVSPQPLPVDTDVLWASGSTQAFRDPPNVSSGDGNASGPNDGTFVVIATYDNTDTISFTVYGFDAQDAIGSQSASVDAVTATIYWYMAGSETGGGGTGTVTAQLRDGATETLLGSPVTLTHSLVSTNSQEIVFTGVASWDNLADLEVVISGKSDTTIRTRYFLDAVSVVVTYTP